MKQVLIKNGQLLSPVNKYHYDTLDILIENGKIAKIAKDIQADSEVIDATGMIVTPGLIDIHTHCYPSASLGIAPDELGIARGATTIFDAGSSGAANYEDFRKNFIEPSTTKVFTLLNVSETGLAQKHELDDMTKINREKLNEIVDKYRDNIVGLKARASASVVGAMGFKPIALAATIAHDVQLPLMVHVGNYPPSLKEVLNVLDQGDVVTHAYHGKPGGILEDDAIIQEATQARTRGVLFDIGHGSASFSFPVFQKAYSLGFDCDLISTDLHVENYRGPVFNLPAVLSKMINCQESLEVAIEKVTSTPARHYQLAGLGELVEGYIGDITLMKIEECDEEVEDAMKATLRLKKKVVVKTVIASKGDHSEVFRCNINGCN